MSFNISVAELVQEHVSYFYREENTGMVLGSKKLRILGSTHIHWKQSLPHCRNLLFKVCNASTLFLLETFPVYILREFEFQTGINKLPRYKDRQKKAFNKF
jgi:hypothetical protein